jgi:hypothetical protein
MPGSMSASKCRRLASLVFGCRPGTTKRCSTSASTLLSLPPIPTELGAVRALPDLAGDKLLALFSRAAARGFVDVLGLLQRFTREELIALAARKDRGFSRARLAEAFRVLPTIRRDRFEVDDSSYDAMCSMFLDWRGELVGRP